MIHCSCGSRPPRHLVAAAIVGLALAGCPGRLANPERFPSLGSDASGPSSDGGSAGDDVPAMLATSCGVGAACHNATTPPIASAPASPGRAAIVLSTTPPIRRAPT
jgi:hypothetical protein